MPDGTNLGALIDGGFESLLTIVYDYYYRRFNPVEIQVEGMYQPSFGTEYKEIATDAAKAEKVITAIRNSFTEKSKNYISLAFLSGDENRYLALFKYIISGFKLGYKLDDYMKLDYVLNVHELAKNVGREAHLLKGFVRFRTVTGFYYSDISPKNNCLPILAEHFTDRFKDERFIIHDVGRNTAVVYDGREWVLTDMPDELSLLSKDNSDIYTKLWTTFYNAIGIEERMNPKLRRSLMPKRFWKHLTEMNTVS